MTFTPLKRMNDWETISLVDSKGRTRSFAKGSIVTIRWPDGSIQEVKIQHRVRHKTYSDHGHLQTAISTIPYFEASVNGARIKLDLDKVEVDL